jgi:hypothetical protein
VVRGRTALGNTYELPKVTVRPEVAHALAHLSQLTGLSKTYLLRSAVESYVSALGLVFPVTNTPTPYNRKDLSNARSTP